MNKVILYCALSSLLLSGCATNSFEKFYQGNLDGRTQTNFDASYRPPGGQVVVYPSSDLPRDVPNLIERGFVPIGKSAFYGPDNIDSAKLIRAQAKKIHADIVLFISGYRDTISGVAPVTVPNTSTSVTNGTATAYGSGGYATANGSAVTTTYDTTTAMVPFSQNRFNFVAVYFVKVRSRIGMFVGPLSDEERQQLQTNTGVKVKYVIEDTPAFLANVFPGDFVLGINDDAISSPTVFSAALIKYQGQDVTLHLVRRGQAITKTVHINTLEGAEASANSR